LQRLALAQLIWGYTMGSAYQLAAENEIGSLKAGKQADFIVLSHDPFGVHPEKIHGINVLQPLWVGKRFFSANATFDMTLGECCISVPHLSYQKSCVFLFPID